MVDAVGTQWRHIYEVQQNLFNNNLVYNIFTVWYGFNVVDFHVCYNNLNH